MYDDFAARTDLECVTGSRALAGTGQFGPGAAHDLGNLLQAATSAINIIEREAGAGAAQLRRAIDGARVSIGHASELVRRVMDSSRTPATDSEGCSLEQCLSEIGAIVTPSADQAEGVSFTIEADLPLVACDRVGLHNALLNLILNARDAIGQEGRIAVQARKMAGGDLVEISVADDGIGMSPATIELAFEPFFTTKCDGLGGIGLPMVERFVTAAGGAIAIDSEPGTGTIVRMRLPAAGGAQDQGRKQQ